MQHSTSHLQEIDRLKKIEGQIRGVIRMIEEQRYCVDILTLIAAACNALKRVEESILERHLRSCVDASFEGGSAEERAEKIEEIITLLRRARR